MVLGICRNLQEQYYDKATRMRYEPRTLWGVIVVWGILGLDDMKSGEQALTKAEWEKLKNVIDNFEDELLLKLAITTGIRREDIVSIKIANISLSDATLTFHEQKKRLDRTIPLNHEVVQLINKYIKTISKRDLLFDFTGRTAWNKLNRLCKFAGIPPRPFHALRATCVKFCQAAHWKPSEVSKLTGDSLRIIEEYYAIPSDSEMKETVNRQSII